MHTVKITIEQRNRFGDRIIREYERLVYDDEEERSVGNLYNRTHSDAYSEYWHRKSRENIHEADMDQIIDSIEEYYDMLKNLY